MSGWVPFDCDGWPEVAALLTATGQPWPRAAAIYDLRWHADRSDMRGRPYFKSRWNWSDFRTQQLHGSAQWLDPIRQQRTTSGPPAGQQPANSRPTADERVKADSTAETTSAPPARQQSTTSGPPADHQASLPIRARPPSPSPSQPPSQGEETSAGEPPERPPDRFPEVARYFGETVHRAIGRRPSQGPDRKSKPGQKLLRLVKQDADLVLDAFRFVAESESDRARFLRGEVEDRQGKVFVLTLETVLRHVDEYAELYRAEQGGNVVNLRPRARGEHPSERRPEPTQAELEAANPNFWDDL